MGFFDRISEGLSRSRDKFKESMNVLLDRGPDLDEEFWEGLEETLILSDVGGAAASDIVENLRDQATRKALPDAYAVLDLLNDEIAGAFTEPGADIFGGDEAVVLFVGINGTGKTTTVGKLAKAETDAGRAVILGSADTFRAAAIEQLAVWADRAQVPLVRQSEGADPAAVVFDAAAAARKQGIDVLIVDTAGRLHNKKNLLDELAKINRVLARELPESSRETLLVLDASTGQNALMQAKEFTKAAEITGIVLTKLDGTAKGGVVFAVKRELGIPVKFIGVGEGAEDLQPFSGADFVRAMFERDGQENAE